MPGEVAVSIESVRALCIGMWDSEGGREEEEGCAYPRIVRQMLMRRSAPQSAIMKTPSGGTGDEGYVSNVHLLAWMVRDGRGGERTEYGDDDD